MLIKILECWRNIDILFHNISERLYNTRVINFMSQSWFDAEKKMLRYFFRCS